RDSTLSSECSTKTSTSRDMATGSPESYRATPWQFLAGYLEEALPGAYVLGDGQRQSGSPVGLADQPVSRDRPMKMKPRGADEPESCVPEERRSEVECRSVCRGEQVTSTPPRHNVRHPVLCVP